MNSNNNIDNQSSTTFIVLAIVFIVIALLLYTIISSNYDLRKNTNATNDALNKDNNTSRDVNDPTDNTAYSNQITKKVETEIATYTSTLYDKDANRVHNITLATSKLNNKIIKKGEEFSFNNTIGPMGAEQGFKEAIGFDSNGKNIKVYGGGMCQISSTVYNCALIANLSITERHAHSKRVYYVPVDRDATVYYGSLDLKFVNNTDGDIKILASNTNTNVTIKFIKITEQLTENT